MNRQLLILFSIFLFCVHSYASEDLLEEEFIEKKVKFYAVADYMTASKSTASASLNALGLGASAQYALQENIALNAGIRQLFSLVSAENLSTNLFFGVTYSFSDALISKKKIIRYKGKKTIESLDLGRNSWYIQALTSQYAFNTSTSTVNYVGLGLSGYYEYVTDSSYTFIAGARFESVSREGDSITPITVFSGMGFWF